MGTQAHWFSARWRFRETFEDGESEGWRYTDYLSDAKLELDGRTGEIQKRVGPKRDYTFVPHSTIAAKRYCEATTRAQQFGASYASTTWSCPRYGVETIDGKLMCRQHAAMYRRDNGLEAHS